MILFLVLANIVLTMFIASGQILQEVLTVLLLGFGLQCIIAILSAAYVLFWF